MSPSPVVPQLCPSPTLNTSLLASAFPSPSCSLSHHVCALLLSFTACSGQPHLLPASSSSSPSSHVCSLPTISLFTVPLTACSCSPNAQDLSQIFLPCHGLPLLIAPFAILPAPAASFVSSCQELPCLQTALTTSPSFPSAAHACSLAACHHPPSSPNFSSLLTYCFLLPLCVPCTSHLSSLTRSHVTSMHCCPLPPFLTQHKSLLLLLAFTTSLSYLLSLPLLPACSCHRLLPILVNMSLL